jgi:hypothetical protein
MSEEFDKSIKWIDETRKRFVYFTSPVVYLTQALDALENKTKEAHELRQAFISLVDDLEKSPQTITYDRDALKAWIEHVLAWSPPEKSKKF